MPEALFGQLTSSGAAAPLDVLLRLVIAVGLGGLVAWVYRRTRTDYVATFPATLVLLAVLIAMVTQVIGDSVARAFSLVGALSIVRFRTVVRDTQDTAFVIFAVVVGMACGASDPRVAVIGIGVVGAAAFVMRPSPSAVEAPYRLTVRIPIGQDLGRLAGDAIDGLVSSWRLSSIETARQGVAIDATYIVRLRAGQRADDLVVALNRIDGFQQVTVSSLDTTEPAL